jgi:hypothetical protein
MVTSDAVKATAQQVVDTLSVNRNDKLRDVQNQLAILEGRKKTAMNYALEATDETEQREWRQKEREIREQIDGLRTEALAYEKANVDRQWLEGILAVGLENFTDAAMAARGELQDQLIHSLFSYVKVKASGTNRHRTARVVEARFAGTDEVYREEPDDDTGGTEVPPGDDPDGSGDTAKPTIMGGKLGQVCLPVSLVSRLLTLVKLVA